MLFSGIPRYRLLEDYTPLERMERFGGHIGHTALYIKRDDVISLGMGGNKVRNIEFWLGEALAEGADLLIIAGAPVSNQCRLVAAAACRAGVECHMLHNADEFPEPSGNSLLNHIMGVHRVCIGVMTPPEREEAAKAYARERRKEGRKPYIVGDHATGALGYVSAALELHAQADLKRCDIRHVVSAGSMGPTEAGLLWGSALLGGAFQLHLPSVEYPVDELKKRVLSVYEKVCDKLQVRPAVDPERILHVYGDYLGEGYDIPTAESIATTKTLASLEGIFIENTYNGKVFTAIESLTKKGVLPADEGACVIHTGGLPALFAQADRFV